MKTILGISGYYHDSAATLLVDGVIIAAAQEERFSREKNDARFPRNAIQYCLREGGINLKDIDAVAFYDKPIVKFTRMLDTFLAIAPLGIKNWFKVMPSWLSEKLNLRQTLRYELKDLKKSCPILFTEHHIAHAASAFYPSPFDQSAILTIDGVGEWATTTIALGKENQIDMLQEIRFPHSLGLLYSAFTSYCGFKINSGEYKLMGLAPYGKPKFANIIFNELLDLKKDGSFRLNMDYFSFLSGKYMTNSKFNKLFKYSYRSPGADITSLHMDIAASIQHVINEAVLRLAKKAKDITNMENICLAGGVALNCVANGHLERSNIFKRIWIQPAAGDAGGSLGSALEVWNKEKKNKFQISYSGKFGKVDKMKGSLLGPDFSENQITQCLNQNNAKYIKYEHKEMLNKTASLLSEGLIIGWFQGRMEFGPRSLGSRSILADPRLPNIRSDINMRVKFRESFRPFAPSVLKEKVNEYFDIRTESPYMLFVAPVTESQLIENNGDQLEGLDRLSALRSKIPSVTHVDGSARVQTVSEMNNPLFFKLIKRFEKITNCAVLLNTSFNVRGEPIVCTPDDAYKCFVNTAIDYLVIGNFILKRDEQPILNPKRFNYDLIESNENKI